jgi:hypothetical protein
MSSGNLKDPIENAAECAIAATGKSEATVCKITTQLARNTSPVLK